MKLECQFPGVDYSGCSEKGQLDEVHHMKTCPPERDQNNRELDLAARFNLLLW